MYCLPMRSLHSNWFPIVAKIHVIYQTSLSMKSTTITFDKERRVEWSYFCKCRWKSRLLSTEKKQQTDGILIDIAWTMKKHALLTEDFLKWVDSFYLVKENSILIACLLCKFTWS